MKKIILFVGIIILFACEEKQITEPKINYMISEIIPKQSFWGDTVTIYGNDFGIKNFSSHLIIPDNIYFESENALIWQDNKISFVMPDNSVSGEIEIVIADSLIGSVFIEINPLPEIDTVHIQPGTFNMGSVSGSEDEYPVHNVIIENRLIVSAKEITVREFSNIMGYLPDNNDDLHLPVVNVSWLESIRFCNELSKIEGLDTCYIITDDRVEWNDSSNGWRLPTEAEWEFVAKGNNNNDFPFNKELNDFGWFSQNSGLKIHPGGRKEANENRIYDMNGNVWEWCWDYYDSDYYEVSETINPKGPSNGDYRVKRGGSAIEGSFYARNSNRNSQSSNKDFSGFRIFRNKSE